MRELLAILEGAPLWVRLLLGGVALVVFVALCTWAEVRRTERDGYWNDDHPDKEAGA